MSERVVCPFCGTTQSTASARATEGCFVCGRLMSGREETERPIEEPPGEEPPTAHPETPQPGPPPRWTPPTPRRIELEESDDVSVELAEIEESEARLTWLSALVPFWGLVAVFRRGTPGRPGRSAGLLALSTLSTALLLALPWLLLRVSRPDPENVRQQVERRLEAVAHLVRTYRNDVGELPSQETWERSSNRGDPRFLDPWGRAFRYRPEGDHFVLGTYGADGAPGGQGTDGDVFLPFPLESEDSRR